MAEPFAARFALIRARYGPLVWGVDPSGRLLDRWELGDNPDGLDRFADVVLESAVGSVGVVKPQSAFYERHGWRGIRTLTRLVADARAAGLLVIVDAKRGDVGSSNEAYAEAYLGKGAPIEADALTVHPYLGLDAMGAFVSRANEAGSCLFVVTHSSNSEGRFIQTAVGADGDTVEAALLRHIGELNASLAPGVVGPVGAVVSATSNGPDLDLLTPRALYLAPGVGTQGSTPDDVARMFRSCPDRVLPSASRSLLAAGPSPASLRESLRALEETFRRLLGE